MSHIRITFSTPADEHGWPPAPFERVWAEPMPGLRARIDNVPFFTRDATLDDVVEYKVEPDGVCLFVRVAVPSANSLVRVLLHERQDFDMVQAKLMTMGCTVEGHVERLMLAVSIPASADIQVPMSFLAELEERELLEYEEAIFRSQ